ncbi:cobyrinate a,c-diamide synthase [Terasakiella sp. SH-1]|uniref:cobyrinate a,c-diamide synthase n=1 Tax=Terasakiella sp. SH-1 TaxID=2560057 RepID=UPI001073298F|nr:cobyrinate a,c-diamide synthase [Terasakiella sp. SH-1]
MSTTGLIIAAPNSNSGKTFITLGSLRALQRRGVSVSSAKVGPDYIDPAFHGAATKRLCPNLDGWAMREDTLFHTLHNLSDQSDLIICEGVMGLFDGATLPADSPSNKDGSPADIARRTGWPVVLVIDANAQATSAAALIHGFATFDPDVHVKGVIFNKVGGPSHIQLLKNACERHIPHIDVLGFVPRQNDLALPERHLGLVLAEEHPELESFLNQSADFLENYIDLDKLVSLAQTKPLPSPSANNAFFPPLGQNIAIAKDKAFAFAYPALLHHWQEQGASFSFFSPLSNEAPDPDCDAIYLPGGYPELHCEQLAQNSYFLEALRTRHQNNTTIFGECGGYMVLGKTITDKEGRAHQMAGILDLNTSFAKRKLHLGYRDVTCLVDTPFAKKGERLRGHEFHYATILHEDGTAVFDCRNASGHVLGAAGLQKNNCTASFIHLIDKKC